MRRDVLDLRAFYGSPLGAAARRMIAAKVEQAWGSVKDLDVLGLGYATPFLNMTRDARRIVAAMPAAQGVEAWPNTSHNLACLTDETALPFTQALFDRVLAVHALEESGDPATLMREVSRVMSPQGRAIVVVAARHGLWTHAEKTPFGHGRPFTRRQLETLIGDAELEPAGWTRALYIPPIAWAAPWADSAEQLGSALLPGFAGLILMEATKPAFAVRPRGAAARARVFAPVLSPAGQANRDPGGPLFAPSPLEDRAVRPSFDQPEALGVEPLR
jgi:SAM-dependent methyltransferase